MTTKKTKVNAEGEKRMGLTPELTGTGPRTFPPNKPQALRVWVSSHFSASLGETDWISAGFESAQIGMCALGYRERVGWWHWAAGRGDVLVLS